MDRVESGPRDKAWLLDQEIESVVRSAGRGFPRKRDKKKWIVVGRGTGGRMIEVVYLLDDDGTAFVIHAMPLTTRRKRG